MADSVECLMEILKSFPSVRISSKDLLAPSTECIVLIYVELLKKIGITNLKNPLKTETNYHLSHYDPELRFNIKLYSVINMILQQIGCLDFDLADILQPGVELTANVAKFLNNICLFINEKKEAVDEMVQIASERIEKYRKLAGVKEKLKDDINNQSRKKAELSMQLDQLNKEKCQLEMRMFKYLGEKHNISESLQEINKNLADYEQKINKLESEGTKFDQAIEELKCQIVSSPEQLVQNLENLKIAEQKLHEGEFVISEALQNKNSRVEELTSCEQSANTVMEEIRDINKILHEIRNSEMMMEQIEKEKIKVEQEVDVKKEDIVWVRKTQEEYQQKIDSLNKQLADRKEKAHQKISELQVKDAKNANCMEEIAYIMKELLQQREEYKNKLKAEEEQTHGELLKVQRDSERQIKRVKELNHVFCHLLKEFSKQETSEDS